MKITKKDVEHVARLARLKLSEEEKDEFTVQLAGILDYIGKLNELDTRSVEPMSHVLRIKNVWRQDRRVPCAGETREAILANAPDREESFFKVRKVID